MSVALVLAIVAAFGQNFVVAHDGRVDLFDANAQLVRTTEGVAHPTAVATSTDRIAVVDAVANEIVEIANGGTRRFATGETPIAAAYLGDDLFVLDRDANRLEKIGGSAIAVAPDSAFMQVANGRIYVYSRRDGIVQEIDPGAMRVGRTLTLTPFASDFAIDGTTGLLVDPAAAMIRTFSTVTMQAGEDESFAHAFARGFLRGLIGIDLTRKRRLDLPPGVDRIAGTLSYDSMSGTLYRLGKTKAAVLATGVEPHAFANSGGVVAVWQNGALRLIR